MSITTKYEYFRAIYHRYHAASKQQKKLILDEFCCVTAAITGNMPFGY